MDLKQLEYFVSIIDHGTVSSAAKALYISQPSMSQSMQRLERDLGQTLFVRIGRRLELTDAGRALEAHARTLLRTADSARQAVEAAGRLEYGNVDVAAMASQAMDPMVDIIARFRHEHPKVTVSTKIARNPREVTEMVRSGIAEVGLLGAEEVVGADGLHVRMLRPQRYVVLAPPDAGFELDQVVTAQDLDGRSVIAGQPETHMRKVVDRMKAAGIDLHIGVVAEHREVFIPLVLGGAGVAVVTDAWTTLARRAGLLALPLDPLTLIQIALVSKASDLTPATAAFIRASTPITHL